MQAVVLQSAIYLGTMLLGFSLKQIGLFRTEDRVVLGNVILYITLPAMLISSFNGVRLDY